MLSPPLGRRTEPEALKLRDLSVLELGSRNFEYEARLFNKTDVPHVQRSVEGGQKSNPGVGFSGSSLFGV